MGVDAVLPGQPSVMEATGTLPGFPGARVQDKARGSAGKGQAADSLQLSSEARAEVAKLQARDQEVRAHEQAHMSAGGSLVRSGPTYSFQTGPDGRRYAVGGEVSLDTSAVEGDPKATIRKAQHVRAAALAPANPSAQDHAVAASATRMEAEASAAVAKSSQQGGDDAASRTPPAGYGPDSAQGASGPAGPSSGDPSAGDPRSRSSAVKGFSSLSASDASSGSAGRQRAQGSRLDQWA